MKKTTRIAALFAAAALIFGGLFYSCSDPAGDTGSGTGNSGSGGSTGGTTQGGGNSSSNSTGDGAPSPALPASVGENPVTKEIKLASSGDSRDVIIIKPDGTAEYRYYSNWEGASPDGQTEYTYKYTWNADKQEIYMKVEKLLIYDDELYTYSELMQNIDEILLASLEYRYENEKEEYPDFEKDYPTLDSYKEYLAAKYGYKSFDEYFVAEKERNIKYLKAEFAAETYGYKTEDGKMTLAAKFTGIENMIRGWCTYNDKNQYGSYISIHNVSEVYYDYCYKNSYSSEVGYDGDINTEDKTIVFTTPSKTHYSDGMIDDDELAEKIKTGEIKPVINASYTEDIENGTVTVTFEDGTSFVCEFNSETFTQID